MKVKAHTLFVVLIITLIIGLISGGLIMHSHYHNLAVNKYVNRYKALHNLNSGFNLLMAGEDSGVRSLYGESGDSVYLNQGDWGVFKLVSVRSGGDNRELKKNALLGYKPTGNTAIYIQDKNRPLVLSGKTNIVGDVYASKAGVKRGYRGNTSFSSKSGKLVLGSILTSNTRFEKANSELVKSQLNHLNFKHLAEFDYSNEVPEKLNVSFDSIPTVIHSGRTLFLRNTKLKGKVIISSKSGVIINKSAELEDVLVYAPYVEVARGFKGSVQIVCADSIMIGEDCEFMYPSSLMVIRAKDSPYQSIHIEEGVNFKGIITIHQERSNRIQPRLIIAENTFIEGLVFVDGVVDLKGTVYGEVRCREFKENGLMNATIDRTKMNNHFIVANLYGDSEEQGVAKWLE